tara:strand:- start:325 stop:1044 length:720 start_codon:yes stop_codon:yes gene_type:complete
MQNNISFFYKFLFGINVFFIVHTALFIGVLFLLFFGILYYFLNMKFLNTKNIIMLIVLPSLIALLIFLSQLLLVKINYNPEFLGSSFMFRTGLDGDLTYYNSYMNLIFHRIRDGSFLYQWYEFMIFSFICFIVFFSLNIYFNYFKLDFTNIDKISIFVLFLSMGAYFPYALIFTQSTVIHAKVFDPYLIIPLILVSFFNCPGILERESNFKGFMSLIFFCLGIFFALINLRLYSTQYPI